VVLAALLPGWTWLRTARHGVVTGYRWAFFSATAVLSVGAAATLASHLPPIGDQPGTAVWVHSIAVIGVAIAVHTALVGVVVTWGDHSTLWRQGCGDRPGVAVQVASCSLGVLVAFCYQHSPALVAFAVPVVMALQQTLVLLNQARTDAHTDVKTGLMNAHWWGQLTEREIHRARRAGESLAVLIIDLDHFKQLNDTYGHPVGDTVLTSIATALTHEVRPTDVVGRFGGEEFVLTLPSVNAAEALVTAERLRARILCLDHQVPAQPPPHITASIGIALFPRDGSSVDCLLKAADVALYQAKHRGRNQVRTARSLLSLPIQSRGESVVGMASGGWREHGGTESHHGE
jgi:diguanylate cyclase (GGDEF)-like protein